MGRSCWAVPALVLGTLLCYFHVVFSDSGKIHKYVYNNNGIGVYSFEFETSDGTYRREEGGHSPGNEDLVVRGEYGYIDPNGKRYSIRYVADANGYRPQLDDEDIRFNDRRIV
ncbi:hypothetical protein ABMA28_015656 [Loxostege sticticalis]|uniref:Uncharacterized protein n=1 Tax=Loxostege sticticalis TaxID=481309 RepID=A0ABD0TAS7_LOXSC